MKKSLLVTVLSLMVAFITAYSYLATPVLAAWLGVISFTASTILTTWFTSGTFVGNNWATAMWVTNIGGVLLQIFALIGEQALVKPEIVNFAVLFVNIIINQFGRKYPVTTP